MRVTLEKFRNTRRERRSHYLTADQSQSSTQLASLLIQTPEQSNAKHSSVLKFLFCAGGSGECHAVVQSAAVHFCWIPSERLARNHTVSDSEKAATEKGEPLERIYEVAYGGGRIWMQQVLTITDNWTVSSLLSFLNTSRHCFSQLAGLFCCCCFFYLQVKLKLPS